MRVPSVSELLQVWESARAYGPLQRALALLALACPDRDRDWLLDLSIGERDGLLLELREALFGARIESIAACPACGAQVELAFATHDIRIHNDPIGSDGATIAVAGQSIRFRLPTSRDLLLALREREPDQRQTLLRHCVIDGALGGTIAPQVEAALVAEITRRDPQADIRLALECPNCAHAWEALFDIGGFLWRELDRWAVRLLQEVHVLASAYGWHEADILALTPMRRRIYLDLVAQ